MVTVGIGVAGKCTLLCEQGYREAMTGTLSLYDRRGERLHTIYLGATPQYGKASFFQRMQREIDHIKRQHPRASYVGIADGAQSNWDFLAPHIETQILDFYHAVQYSI